MHLNLHAATPILGHVTCLWVWSISLSNITQVLSGVPIWRYDADIGVKEVFSALRVYFSAPVFL